jgi:hypothetical protein
LYILKNSFDPSKVSTTKHVVVSYLELSIFH